jgi:hypothetical protein
MRKSSWIFGCLVLLAVLPSARAQAPPPSSAPSPASTKHISKPSNTGIDSGTATNGMYRNKTLGFACRIPDGWVLRTDEMNKREDEAHSDSTSGGASSSGARVLLAAFSRPPEARGEEINASVLIAAESVASYPGLTEAAQYFGPLTEVAKAQGFEMDEDPYAIAIGTKTLVRGDFHKNVGTRVMRQSTLALLDHGYAVSITVIGGTDDEVEDLVDGLSFVNAATGTTKK